MDASWSEGPDAAWRRRADWVKGEVEEEGARKLGASAASGTLLSLIALTLLTAAWLDGGIWWFFALVVGVVAIAVLWMGVIRQVLHQRRFGRSHLALQQTPLRPGERFAGKVRTGVPRGDAAPRFRVQLECVRRWKEEHGSGDDRKTEHHRKVLWSEARVTSGELHAGRGGAATLAVPVAFDLPRRPATTAIRGWEGIAWELNLHAELPGLDYRATFELPVVERDGDRSDGDGTLEPRA